MQTHTQVEPKFIEEWHFTCVLFAQERRRVLFYQEDFSNANFPPDHQNPVSCSAEQHTLVSRTICAVNSPKRYARCSVEIGMYIHQIKRYKFIVNTTSWYDQKQLYCTSYYQTDNQSINILIIISVWILFNRVSSILKYKLWGIHLHSIPVIYCCSLHFH